MRSLKRLVIALLAALMLVSYASVPVFAASAADTVLMQPVADLSNYDAGDVAGINAMIQSNATLSAKYKLNEPWNWRFWSGYYGSYSQTSIDFTKEDYFDEARFVGTLSGDLTISNIGSLTQVTLYDHNLSTLTISDMPNLESIYAWDNNLKSVRFKNLPKIERIGLGSRVWSPPTKPINGNKIKNLDLSGLSSLRDVDVTGNSYDGFIDHYVGRKTSFDTVNLGGCKNLRRFSAGGTFGLAVNTFVTEKNQTVTIKSPSSKRRITMNYYPVKSEEHTGPYVDFAYLYAKDLKSWKFTPNVKYSSYTPDAAGFKLKHSLMTVTVVTTNSEDKPATAKTTKVNFPQASVRMTLNKSLTIPAVAYTSDNKTAKVTYSSSKPEVATVSSSGKIVAKAPGSTVITAKSGSKKDTLKVTVVAAGTKATKVKKVTGNVPAQMSVGATKYITPKVSPAKATNVKVTYSSSNKGVVTVDKTGKLTAKKAGVAVITIKAGGKSAKYTVTVM